MLCPNCGANLPDNARFCGKCGSTLSNEVPAQPAMQQPTFEIPEMAWVQPAVQTPAQTSFAPSAYVKKGNLVTAIARSYTRVLAIISLVFLLLAAGLSVAGYFTIKSAALTDMPAFSLAEDITGETLDINEILEDEGIPEDEIDDYFDQAKAALDVTDLNKKDRKLMEELLSSVEDLLKEPSLANLQATAGLMGDAKDILEDVQDDLEMQVYGNMNISPETLENSRVALDAIDDIMEAYDDVEEVTEIVEIVDLALLGLLCLSLLFILLAGFFRLPGLLVPSILLFTPFICALSSIVMGAAFLVAQIVLWIFLAVLNKKHKNTAFA